MKKLIALCLLLPTALMSEPPKPPSDSRHPCCESSKATKALKAAGVLALGGSLLALGMAADHLIKQNDHIIWQNDTNRKTLIKVHALSDTMVTHPDIIYDRNMEDSIDEHNERIIRRFEKIKADLVQASNGAPEGSAAGKKTREKIRKVQRSIDALKEALED
jgi:hypothetical protein